MDFIPQFTAVAAVLSLLGVTLWWLRSRGFAAMPVRKSAGRRLACLERLPLSPQHTLHLLRRHKAVRQAHLAEVLQDEPRNVM